MTIVAVSYGKSIVGVFCWAWPRSSCCFVALETKRKSGWGICGSSWFVLVLVCVMICHFSPVLANCALYCLFHRLCRYLDRATEHLRPNSEKKKAVHVTSTAGLPPSASHQLPSVCFVCLGLAEIKHMHTNTKIFFFRPAPLWLSPDRRTCCADERIIQMHILCPSLRSRKWSADLYAVRSLVRPNNKQETQKQSKTTKPIPTTPSENSSNRDSSNGASNLCANEFEILHRNKRTPPDHIARSCEDVQ